MFFKKKRINYVKRIFLIFLLMFVTYWVICIDFVSLFGFFFFNKFSKFKNNFILFLKKKLFLLKLIVFLIKKNIFLKKKIFLLESKLIILNKLKFKNDIFSKILSISKFKKHKYIIAKVIFVKILSKHNILIDKGSDFFFKHKNYYLVNNKGLLGRIIYIKRHFSFVKLLCDYKNIVPVQIMRNNLRFNVYGSGYSNFLKTKKLSSLLDIQLGDVLVTSGVDNFYPVGYPVGIVYNIIFQKNYTCKIIIIKTFVNFNSLSYVLVKSNTD